MDNRVVGRKGQETRSRLLEALLKALQADAWRNVTVPQVAASAEVSPATFYQYFPSLDAAFDVLLVDLVVDGDQLPVEVEAIARLRARERRRPFAYTPPPAHVAEYVRRVPAVSAIQWTGANTAAVTELVGDRFRELGPDEREHAGPSGRLKDGDFEWPVPVGWWLVLGADDKVELVSAQKFASVYRPAAIEERSGYGDGGRG